MGGIDFELPNYTPPSSPLPPLLFLSLPSPLGRHGWQREQHLHLRVNTQYERAAIVFDRKIIAGMQAPSLPYRRRGICGLVIVVCSLLEQSK